MPNLNQVNLMGNLTRDPEIKYTPKGTPIAELGLAINRYYTTEGGEKKEETTFVDVTLYGRQAEIAKEYLGKGKPVFIQGRLQLDTWDDKQTGQKRSKMRVIGEGLQLIEKREGSGNGGEPRQPSQGGGGASRPASQPSPQRSQPAQSAPAGGSNDDSDDDIPF